MLASSSRTSGLASHSSEPWSSTHRFAVHLDLYDPGICKSAYITTSFDSHIAFSYTSERAPYYIRMPVTSTSVLAFNRKDELAPELMPGFEVDSLRNLEIMYEQRNLIAVPGVTLSKGGEFAFTKSQPMVGNVSTFRRKTG